MHDQIKVNLIDRKMAKLSGVNEIEKKIPNDLTVIRTGEHSIVSRAL